MCRGAGAHQRFAGGAGALQGRPGCPLCALFQLHMLLEEPDVKNGDAPSHWGWVLRPTDDDVLDLDTGLNHGHRRVLAVGVHQEVQQLHEPFEP